VEPRDAVCSLEEATQELFQDLEAIASDEEHDNLELKKRLKKMKQTASGSFDEVSADVLISLVFNEGAKFMNYGEIGVEPPGGSNRKSAEIQSRTFAEMQGAIGKFLAKMDGPQMDNVREQLEVARQKREDEIAEGDEMDGDDEMDDDDDDTDDVPGRVTLVAAPPAAASARSSGPSNGRRKSTTGTASRKGCESYAACSDGAAVT